MKGTVHLKKINGLPAALWGFLTLWLEDVYIQDMGLWHETKPLSFNHSRQLLAIAKIRKSKINSLYATCPKATKWLLLFSWCIMIAATTWWVKQGISDVPLFISMFQLLLEDPMPAPSQMGYVIPSVNSGLTAGSSTNWTCLVLQRKETRSIRLGETAKVYSKSQVSIPQSPLGTKVIIQKFWSFN